MGPGRNTCMSLNGPKTNWTGFFKTEFKLEVCSYKQIPLFLTFFSVYKKQFDELSRGDL